MLDATDDGNVVVARFGGGDAVLSLYFIDRLLLVFLPLLVGEIVVEELLLGWNGGVEEEFDALPNVSDILRFLEQPVAGDDQALNDVTRDNYPVVDFLANSEDTAAVVRADIDELVFHIG